MLTFFMIVPGAGAGEDVREAFLEFGLLFEDLNSDMRLPAADGGARVVGAWMAAGVGSNLKAFECVAGFLTI